MPAKATLVDMSLYTIGGASQLAFIRDAMLRTNIDQVDGRPITRLGKSAQAVKRSATLETTLMSTVSAPTKVTNLDVSALTIGGTSYNADLRGGSFAGQFTLAEGSGVVDFWKYPVVVDKDYTANVKIGVASTAATAIAVAMYGAASALALVFSITINGIPITLPMLGTEFSHAFTDGDVQIWDVALQGRSPDTGAYPTAPTLASTLLEKAFNDPGTALAVAMTSKSVGGLAYAGNFIYSGFSFDFNDASLVNTQYTFASQGAVTATPN